MIQITRLCRGNGLFTAWSITDDLSPIFNPRSGGESKSERALDQSECSTFLYLYLDRIKEYFNRRIFEHVPVILLSDFVVRALRNNFSESVQHHRHFNFASFPEIHPPKLFYGKLDRFPERSAVSSRNVLPPLHLYSFSRFEEKCSLRSYLRIRIVEKRR